MQQAISRQITYQTRFDAGKKTFEILALCSEFFSKLERKLFTDIIKGKNINDLKKEYIKKQQITARQFNSMRLQIEGKIKSAIERQKEQIAELKLRIKGLESSIKKYKSPNKAHQKKRKLFNLRTKLKNLESQTKVKICFGSKKLFNAQFYLKENGFKDFNEWKSKWQESRSSSFFLVGSKDEAAGNQSCQIFNDGDALSLKVRLPNKLSKYGKYLIIRDLKFPYGQKEILETIQTNIQRKLLIKQKNPLSKYIGKAINYRFLKDEKGVRVFVTINQTNESRISKKENGVIGIDINVDHLALVETDRFLNPIKTQSIPLCTYGKNKNQALAIIGDAVSQAVGRATSSQKPLVFEKLDFQKKKTSLKEFSKKRARMLSSFSYKAIINNLKSKAFKSKIETFEVNPAYTSIIGKIKFQKRYGFTTHQAAALTIARRYMQASEKPPHQSFLPDAKGPMRAFFLPARNRKKHLWSYWGKVFGILKAVDVPHFRAAKCRSTSTQLSTCEIKNLENYERDPHRLMSVDKTARSTSLNKSLLHV
jgi:IS605 OrfB family transposase